VVRNPELEQIYVPLWQELAADTPDGRFYQADRGTELFDLYHEIVVTLTGRQTAGVVVQAEVKQAETIATIQVEPALQQVTFVVRKSAETLQVEIISPEGQTLTPVQPGVQYTGQPGQSLEEIWAIQAPTPGVWQVQLNGQGSVTVWKDFAPAPATSTPSPTSTRSPTPTWTATPVPPTPTWTTTPAPSPTRTATPGQPPRLPMPPTPTLSLEGNSRTGATTFYLLVIGGVTLPAVVTAGGWLWLCGSQVHT
jgi:hypothetical protein